MLAIPAPPELGDGNANSSLVLGGLIAIGPSLPGPFRVLDSDGNSFTVSSLVLDSDGNSFNVSNSVLNSDGNSFGVI